MQERIWDELYSSNLSWKKETLELPNLLKNKNVLELGVGNGKTLASILRQKPSSIIAIDFSQKSIDLCKNQFKNQKNLTLKKANLLSFKSKVKFDVIFVEKVFS